MNEKRKPGSAIKRFLLADDSGPVRTFLRELVRSNEGWSVCAEAENGLAAVELAESLQPDCAILDFAMPGLNGLEAARLIARRSPGTAIVLISMHDGEVLGRHLTAEIKGFVPKSRVAWELLPAIQAVLAGGKYFISGKDETGGVQARV